MGRGRDEFSASCLLPPAFGGEMGRHYSSGVTLLACFLATGNSLDSLL
ncbi:MAG: hypothetical protein F6K36_19625 [Symploca sp. SIO3C6]|nr:hypothetical protein [Symploca sp. SIO3C6]